MIYVFLNTKNASIMNDKTFVFIVVGIVVAHFIFAVVYLIWKIASAPKSNDSDIEDHTPHDVEEDNV